MKKAFITGGAGFIGSYLAEALVRDGWRVTVFDNLSNGRLSFLAPVRRASGFRFIKGDLLNRSQLGRAMDGSYDTVFHLAANSDIPKGTKNPGWDFEQGTVATFHVLEAMRKTGVKKIVLASSSAVYGEAGARSLTEDHGPLQPISFYGASKLACEGLISAYVHNYGFQAWIFRFGNVIGEHATHGAMYDFVKRLRTNPRKLTVLGNGRQAKPYLYVKDCVEGMMHGYRRSRHPYNLFNLSPAGATSVSRLAAWTIQGMGLNKTKIHYSGGLRGWSGDVPQVRLDGGKLKRLGWAPRLSSDDAVRWGIRCYLKDLGLWNPQSAPKGTPDPNRPLWGAIRNPQ